MRYLMFAAAIAILTGCARETGDADEIVDEPAEEVYESVSDTINGMLEEAEEVEDVLSDRAKALESAVDN